MAYIYLTYHCGTVVENRKTITKAIFERLSGYISLFYKGEWEKGSWEFEGGFCIRASLPHEAKLPPTDTILGVLKSRFVIRDIKTNTRTVPEVHVVPAPPIE